MAYPLPTNLDNCDGLLYCVAKWAEQTTNGLFWAIILAGFVIVVIMSTQRFGMTRSYGFGSIIGLLASTWIATMQLMAWWLATIFILNGALGMAILLLNER
jgi:preprotein translocase subunit SecG